MCVSSAVPVGLRSREYYLNRFTDADRVTRHGDVLLDGGTATVREGTRAETLREFVAATLHANVVWFALCPCLWSKF